MKKIIALLLAAALMLTLSGCSVSDTLKGFAEEISGLVPNDLEHLLDSTLGKEPDSPGHESILSTGYANMLKSEKYYISYSLAPGGGQIEYGRSGIRAGSRFAGSSIILENGQYYLLDDVNLTATAVDPANYPEAPIMIDASDIEYVEYSDGEMNGMALTREDYSAAGGSVTFWLDGADLYAIDVRQAGCTALLYVSSFTKHVPSDLVSIPANYTIVN